MTARKDANEFWLKVSASIQNATDRGDTNFDGIRRAVEPTKKNITSAIFYWINPT